MGSSGEKAFPLDVAIVGGGIIGVMTALGLIHRGMRVTIYERAEDWHEIGAGFAFTAVARDCMQRISPAILEVLSRISEKTSSSEHTRYWNGFHPRSKDEAQDEATALLFQMAGKELDFWGCLRSHLLFGMAALLPEGTAQFGKQLVEYNDDASKGKVMLGFSDGTEAEADVLIGCDGIHSTTRKVLLGSDHPAAKPRYTHTVAYRTLVPIDAAIAALGEDKARSACMHCGPDANMMTYPVMNGTLFNIALFAHESDEFPDPIRMTAPATQDQVKRAVQGWGPHVAEIASLFPEDGMVKWGIFDMGVPAPTYARGRVAVAGDAAHASSPHQGVGACMGVEDALVICEVLDVAQESLANMGGLSTRDSNAREKQVTATGAVEQALHSFSETRMQRTQWLVRSSREMGEMYQWRYGPTGRDVARCKAKLDLASRTVWDFDVNKMVADARSRAKAW